VARKVEIQIPKELGLTKTQVTALQNSFQKQLVEKLKETHASTKSKSKLMVVDVRAKNKNQVV
jgi:hypothetical protein